MLAFLYLITATLFGDLLARRFLNYTSILHRAAAGFLVGLLLSTCATYLGALLFAGTGRTLLYANILYFAAAAGGIYLLFPGRGVWISELRQLAMGRKARNAGFDGQQPAVRPPGDWRIDLIVISVCMAIGCWLMFATLDFSEGSFRFAIKSWSDFGANLSLAQSFALGENYPTDHPFYPGEIIRYHFLFWFLSANLSFLGLNVVWSVNILSLLSLLALLFLLLTFAETLFRSRAVARISLLLFFFASSSLSYIPFLYGQTTLAAALNAVLAQRDFLRSGFPYRGDDWGALSVTVFSNQRQLLSAVGIILLVLVHLIQFYRRRGALGDRPAPRESLPDETPELPQALPQGSGSLHSLVFCGLLIGVLPYWNSAVFVAACIIMGSLFVLFPARKHIGLLIGTIILIGLPQILLLRSGNTAPGHSFFNWGYIVADPTAWKLVEYLAWTFGFKWILIFAALFFVTGAYRKLFLALSAPFLVVFAFQLSTDVFNNHKLLNIWTVLTSVYVAYALWRIGRKNVARTILSVVLALLMTFGAFIDLVPIHNDTFVAVPHHNDRLTEWLLHNTSGSDIFLTDTILSHPILFSGRKVFLANTLFAWTAGYDVAARERTHRQMLTTHDLGELKGLLRENDIDYIAFDDGLRKSTLIRGINEDLVALNFAFVFDDVDGKYGNLKIYRVSE